MNNILIKTLKFTIPLCIGSMLLTSCKESAVKRDFPAPPVSEELNPNGHINAKPKVEKRVDSAIRIPRVVKSKVPKLPPLSDDSEKNIYSISAVNAPLQDLLFKLAQDSNKEIDIYSDVTGSVTINAINQPLETILDRIVRQTGFIYELNNRAIVIKPDLPEWRNYSVDYVNIKKESLETIDMQMSVSSSADGNDAAGGTASSTKVSVESSHDFWGNLEKNIQLLAQIDPNSKKTNVGMQENAENGSDQGNMVGETGFSQNTVVNGEAGVISVYTTAKKHRAVKNYINEITARAERQVLIEATVVEVELNDSFQSGIDWSLLNGMFGSSGGLQLSSPFSGPSDGFSVATIDSSGNPSGVGEYNVMANLKLLNKFGDSKVLSSPKIMAINNQTALLKVVENLVYFTVDVNTNTNQDATNTTYETEVKTIPVGFTMSVTPFVGDNGEVSLNVRPTITEQIGSIKDPNPSLTLVDSEIPIIQEKEMSSVLKLRDRQTAVIGGLIEDSNVSSKAGVPWLSDFPVIGDVFAQRDDSTNKRELIIFIKPTIIKNPDVDHGDLQSVGRFLKTKNY